MLAKIKEQINNLFNNNAFAVKREQVEDSQFILIYGRKMDTCKIRKTHFLHL
jgi:hypothetical protein